MFRTILEMAKQQRLLLGAVLIVAVVLIVFANAPFIPVLAGCMLAVGVSILRRRK